MGTGSHLGIETFNLATRIKVVHVPARPGEGIADTSANTVAGRTDYLLAPIQLATCDTKLSPYKAKLNNVWDTPPGRYGVCFAVVRRRGPSARGWGCAPGGGRAQERRRPAIGVPLLRSDADAQPARPWRGCAGRELPDGRSRRGRVAITRFAPPDAGAPFRAPAARGPSPRPPAGGGRATRGAEGGTPRAFDGRPLHRDAGAPTFF